MTGQMKNDLCLICASEQGCSVDYKALVKSNHMEYILEEYPSLEDAWAVLRGIQYYREYKGRSRDITCLEDSAILCHFCLIKLIYMTKSVYDLTSLLDKKITIEPTLLQSPQKPKSSLADTKGKEADFKEKAVVSSQVASRSSQVADSISQAAGSSSQKKGISRQIAGMSSQEASRAAGSSQAAGSNKAVNKSREAVKTKLKEADERKENVIASKLVQGGVRESSRIAQTHQRRPSHPQEAWVINKQAISQPPVKVTTIHGTSSQTSRSKRISSVGSTSRPASLTSRPASLTSRPASLTSRPASLTSRPASLTSRPASLTSRHADLTSRPASLTGRPASLSSVPSRPVPVNKSSGVHNTFGDQAEIVYPPSPSLTPSPELIQTDNKGNDKQVDSERTRSRRSMPVKSMVDTHNIPTDTNFIPTDTHTIPTDTHKIPTQRNRIPSRRKLESLGYLETEKQEKKVESVSDVHMETVNSNTNHSERPSSLESVPMNRGNASQHINKELPVKRRIEAQHIENELPAKRSRVPTKRMIESEVKWEKIAESNEVMKPRRISAPLPARDVKVSATVPAKRVSVDSFKFTKKKETIISSTVKQFEWQKDEFRAKQLNLLDKVLSEGNWAIKSGKHMEKEVFDNAQNEETYLKGISNLLAHFGGLSSSPLKCKESSPPAKAKQKQEPGKSESSSAWSREDSTETRTNRRRSNIPILNPAVSSKNKTSSKTNETGESSKGKLNGSTKPIMARHSIGVMNSSSLKSKEEIKSNHSVSTRRSVLPTKSDLVSLKEDNGIKPNFGKNKDGRINKPYRKKSVAIIEISSEANKVAVCVTKPVLPGIQLRAGRLVASKARENDEPSKGKRVVGADEKNKISGKVATSNSESKDMPKKKMTYKKIKTIHSTSNSEKVSLEKRSMLEGKGRMICPVCSILQGRSDFINHVKKEHGGGKCSQCSRVLNTGAELAEHLDKICYPITAKISAERKSRTNKSTNPSTNHSNLEPIASNSIINTSNTNNETTEKQTSNTKESTTQKVVVTKAGEVTEIGQRPMPFIDETVQNSDDLEEKELGFDDDSDQELEDGKFKYRLNMTGINEINCDDGSNKQSQDAVDAQNMNINECIAPEKGSDNVVEDTENVSGSLEIVSVTSAMFSPILEMVASTSENDHASEDNQQIIADQKTNSEPVVPVIDCVPAEKNAILSKKKAAFDAPAGKIATLDAPAGKKAALDAPAEKKVALDAPAGKKVALDAPVGKKSAIDAPEGKKAALDAPAGKEATLDAPAGKKAALDAPVGKKSAIDAPAGKKAALDAPAGKKAALDAPAGKKAALHAPARKKAALEASAGKIAPLKAPAGEKTAPDAPEGKKAALDAPEGKSAPKQLYIVKKSVTGRKGKRYLDKEESQSQVNVQPAKKLAKRSSILQQSQKSLTCIEPKGVAVDRQMTGPSEGEAGIKISTGGRAQRKTRSIQERNPDFIVSSIGKINLSKKQCSDAQKEDETDDHIKDSDNLNSNVRLDSIYKIPTEADPILSENKDVNKCLLNKVLLELPTPTGLDTSEYFDANESRAKSTDSVVDNEMNNTLNDESVFNSADNANDSKCSVDINAKDEINPESLGNIDRSHVEANDESDTEGNGDANGNVVSKMDDIANEKSDGECSDDFSSQAGKWFNINQE